MKLDINKIQSPRAIENGFTKLNYLQLDFTGKCNDSCKYCSGVYNHRGNDIPFEKAVEILDSVIEGMNIKEVYVTCNAEFTLYTYCLDVIDYIEDTFKGVIIRQDSNGLFIPDGFIKRLNTLENNFYDLSISFDSGDKNTYNYFHNKDNFETVIKNVKRYLTELTNPNVIFRFSTIYWNDEQFNTAISYIKKLVEDYNKTGIEISNASPRAITRYNVESNEIIIFKRCSYTPELVPINFSDESNGFIYKKYNEATGKYYKEQMITKDWNGIRKPVSYDNNCPILNNGLFIRVDGQICSCLGNMNSEKDGLGNIYDQKVTADWFREIFNSEKRKEQQRLNATTGAFEHCHKCVSRISF